MRITPKPTHDLIYATSVGAQSDIFVLGLDGSAAPVRLNAGSVSRDPSPSPDGTKVVFAVSQTLPDGTAQNDLYVVDRSGLNIRRLTQMPGMEYEPAWSPDGTQIVFTASDPAGPGPDLWLINVDGTGLRNLTAAMPGDVTDKRNPAWSPDGRRVAFIAARGGDHKVWTIGIDGFGAAQLTTDAGFDTSPTWSPDGNQVAFSRYNTTVPANGWDIMIVPVTGGASTRLAHAGDQLVPAWSPDGVYIAVAGTVVAGQGQQNIYTMRTDGSGLRLRTVNTAWGGGNAPTWITRQ